MHHYEHYRCLVDGGIVAGNLTIIAVVVIHNVLILLV